MTTAHQVKSTQCVPRLDYDSLTFVVSLYRSTLHLTPVIVARVRQDAEIHDELRNLRITERRLVNRLSELVAEEAGDGATHSK